MDEKGNIIKHYRKNGESLTTLTVFILNTRVGATANAFVLLKFLIKELGQLPRQKNKLLLHVNSCDLTQLRKGPPDLFYQNKTARVLQPSPFLFWTLVLAQPPTLSSY